jgi:hypothetical protein
VFTAFTLAGFGMSRYFARNRGPHWVYKRIITFAAGVTSMVVVIIFVWVKFKEGAWLVVVLFVLGVPALIWLNRQYGLEAMVLENIGSRRSKSGPPDPPTYSRRTVFVFVDDFDLATIAALRYARSLRATNLQAVHFVIDNIQSDRLRQDWVRANTGIALDFVDCPDRRLAAAAAAVVKAEAELPGVGVTAILPRRSYAPVVGRLLHDRTADRIAGVISRIPHAVATIVPFDVRSRVEVLVARQAAGTAPEPSATLPAERPGTTRRPPDTGDLSQGSEPASPASKKDQKGNDGGSGPAAGSDSPDPATGPDRTPGLAPDVPARPGDAAGGGTAATAQDGQPIEPGLRVPDNDEYDRPVPPAGVTPIGTITQPGRSVVQGRVHAVEIRPVERNTVLACDVADSTGELTALFYGRSNIPGLRPGSKVRLRGPVGMRDGQPVMINPAYELLAQSTESASRPPRRRGRGARGQDGRGQDGNGQDGDENTGGQSP